MSVNMDNLCEVDDYTIDSLKEKVDALAYEINKGTFISSVYIKEKANSIIRTIDNYLHEHKKVVSKKWQQQKSYGKE